MSPVSSASLRPETAHPGLTPTLPAQGETSVLLVYHLGPRQVSAARGWLAAGGAVAALSADPAATKHVGGAVRMLPEGSLPGFEDGALVGVTFDLVELAVAEMLRRRPAIGRWLQHAGGPEVDRYLCRSFLRDVGNFFALLFLVASPELEGFESVVLERTWPNGFDFAFLAEVVRRDGITLASPLAAALGRLAFAVEAIPAWRRCATTAGLAARELGRLWIAWLRRLRPRSSRLPRRPLVIRSYDEDWGVDLGGRRRLRNLDFVVDQVTISPSEVVIWAEDGVPGERDDVLLSRGYGVLRRHMVDIGPAAFVTRVLPALASATALFARIAFAERWWQRPMRTLLEERLLWREVARRVRPRVFLALNDLDASGVARTLTLRREGCLTVEYEFSSHWRTDARGWVPDYVYGFTVVDVMVTWGALHSRHLLNHRGVIGECWEVGCLWSEHARTIRDDPEVGGPFRDALEHEATISLADFDRIVGVFDTSTASFFGPDDMVAFYAGIAALARRLPSVLFIGKPKRPIESVFSRGVGGRDVEALLRDAPNVVLLGTAFETAAVVGLSDVSVNACYTSPAIETIGAGRPALYYDPTDLFPGSFFRQVPRFVAEDADELGILVEESLAADEDAVAADLRARFTDFEGHFDGRAISRLRQRLRAALDD